MATAGSAPGAPRLPAIGGAARPPTPQRPAAPAAAAAAARKRSPPGVRATPPRKRLRVGPKEEARPPRPQPEPAEAAGGAGSSLEVRVLEEPAEAGGERFVTSYRMFDSHAELKAAEVLLGRFEDRLPCDSPPESVRARFPASLLRKGHLLVTSVSQSEPYVVIRRVQTSRMEFVKYFSSASEGHREAQLHEAMHEAYPDHVVRVVESGTVGRCRGGGRRVPKPCCPSSCPDIEFYLVTEDPGPGFRMAYDSDMGDDPLESFLHPVLRKLAEMRSAMGFGHWDLHGFNLVHNSETGEFAMLDMGFSVADPCAVGISPRSGSGLGLSDTSLQVPREVLQDFHGDKSLFGYYYDIGRVMMHCNNGVRDALLRKYRVRTRNFYRDYADIIKKRNPAFPNRIVASSVIEIDLKKCPVARIALELTAREPELKALIRQGLLGELDRPAALRPLRRPDELFIVKLI